MTERIAFETEIDLQVLLGRVAQRDLPPHRHQDWPMKKDQKHHANSQAGHHAAPQAPVPPRLCLIMLGHNAILLPPCHRAKTNYRDSASECHLAIACKQLWRDAF
jgi:hypothetical protein